MGGNNPDFLEYQSHTHIDTELSFFDILSKRQVIKLVISPSYGKTKYF